jgi:hypothetical protein
MTATLHQVLAGEACAPVYRLVERTSARTIARVAERAGWHAMLLDGALLASKADFLDAAGRALSFPPWAGHNWDAFEELVNDLSWQPWAEGYLLLFERASWLAKAQPKVISVALDILATAAENRRAAGLVPLAVVLRGAGALAADLPLLTISR